MPANEVLAQQQIKLDTGKYLKLLPHLHGTDGFFAAVFERKAEAVKAVSAKVAIKVTEVVEAKLAKKATAKPKTAKVVKEKVAKVVKPKQLSEK